MKMKTICMRVLFFGEGKEAGGIWAPPVRLNFVRAQTPSEVVRGVHVRESEIGCCGHWETREKGVVVQGERLASTMLL